MTLITVKIPRPIAMGISTDMIADSCAFLIFVDLGKYLGIVELRLFLFSSSSVPFDKELFLLVIIVDQGFVST